MNKELTAEETEMRLTIEQQLALAKKVYPDVEWVICKDFIMLGSGMVVSTLPRGPWRECDCFNPSLTGEDWQKLQALDVIVAAFKRPVAVYNPINSAFIHGFRVPIDKYHEGIDILEAAALALLQGDGG